MENKLAEAIFEDNVDLVNSLIKKGVDINAINKQGMTPLMHAVEAEKGETPLDFAIHYKSNKVIKFLNEKMP